MTYVRKTLGRSAAGGGPFGAVYEIGALLALQESLEGAQQYTLEPACLLRRPFSVWLEQVGRQDGGQGEGDQRRGQQRLLRGRCDGRFPRAELQHEVRIACGRCGIVCPAINRPEPLPELIAAGVSVAIGADGVHSTMRKALFGAGSAEFTGIVAWRGLIPADTGLVAFGLAATALTAGITFVIKAIVPKKRRDAAQGSETTP